MMEKIFKGMLLVLLSPLLALVSVLMIRDETPEGRLERVRYWTGIIFLNYPSALAGVILKGIISVDKGRF